MSFKRNSPLAMASSSLVAVLAVASASQAATLSGNINVDNAHTTYVSMDDSMAGLQVASGSNWPTTNSFAGVDLTPGLPYFVHVDATDVGGIAAFLGDFTLTGSGHSFSGNTSAVTTGVNWLVSTTGWSGYVAATSYGAYGVSPWNTTVPAPPANPAAEWIWSADNDDDNRVYFSLAIIPTPVDLSIAQTLDSVPPFNIGDTVQYTITVNNEDADTAANVDITDVPGNMTITSVSSINCTAFPCTLAAMAGGSQEIITLLATIDAAGSFSNSASVSSITGDPNSANNSVTDIGGTAAPVTVPTLPQWALLSLVLLMLTAGSGIVTSYGRRNLTLSFK